MPPEWEIFIMTVIQYILGAVLIVCAIFLTVVVLFQDKSKGLSGAIGGGASETYFGKNKGSSKNKKLSKLTAIVSIVFTVLVFVTFIFS